MMAVLLLKNVISINNKLRSQNGNEENNGIFMAPDMGDLRQQLRSKAAQPQNPQPKVPQSAPVAKFLSLIHIYFLLLMEMMFILMKLISTVS